MRQKSVGAVVEVAIDSQRGMSRSAGPGEGTCLHQTSVVGAFSCLSTNGTLDKNFNKKRQVLEKFKNIDQKLQIGLILSLKGSYVLEEQSLGTVILDNDLPSLGLWHSLRQCRQYQVDGYPRNHKWGSPMKCYSAIVYLYIYKAICITACLIIMVGCLSYGAYGQYTQAIVLLNLKQSTVTLGMQVFYSIGILCSYCLQITPLFRMLRPKNFTPQKGYLLRGATAMILVLIAYRLPNLGQFLNFQGALTGTLITFVMPVACFMKTHRELEKWERMLCFGCLGYGIIGGFVASGCALQAMIESDQKQSLI